jgi:hypothetical protein
MFRTQLRTQLIKFFPESVSFAVGYRATREPGLMYQGSLRFMESSVSLLWPLRRE